MKRIGLLLGIVALCVGCGGSGGSGGGSPEPTQSISVGIRLNQDGLTEEERLVTRFCEAPLTIDGQSEVLADELTDLLESRLTYLQSGTWSGSVKVIIGNNPTDPIHNIQFFDPIVVNGSIQSFSLNGSSVSFRNYLQAQFQNPPGGPTLYTSVTLVIGG